MKKLILFSLCIPVVLIIIVLINTFLFTSNQDKVPAVTPVKVEQDVVVGKLSQAIQHRTLSTQDSSKFNPEPFLKFNAFLEQTYPLIHQKLEREVVNGYSLLYKWAGSDESLKPVMFLAHIDVVPVEPGTQKDWKYDAFSGQIADGFVWGRGALDMKSTLMGLMEATENLIQTGFRPKRTIYFAFGHDEEIGGSDGAARIAALFKARGIRLAFTLDEGMAILNEALSPAKKQLAVIGLAEKGYVTLKISVETKGGHSSMPPNQTSLGILSKAVSQLEQNQMPASLSGAVGLLFDTIGPDLPFVQKALFANQWLFKGLIIGQLSKKNTTNAMIRTTTAPTIMSGGVKENVLPSKAHALVNFRILPGDTVSDVVTHAKNVIDDPNVQITIHGRVSREASPISSTDSFGHSVIKKTVYQIFPVTSVTPGLVTGGTDSKHYASIADDCYRFIPVIFDPSTPRRIHGTDERIDIKGYVKSIQYYIQLMQNVGNSIEN